MQRRRCLPADPAPARRSDRGECDRAAGMAVTIQIVAKRKLAPAAAKCWIVAKAMAPVDAARQVKAIVDRVDVA